MRQPFPLQWPESWPRTAPATRSWSQFKVSFSQALMSLRHELELLGAANAVITSDLPTRSDGTPYAPGREVSDPGIAVWFVLDGQERVMPCDRWPTHAENMRAIALSIGAMRGLERWGSGNVVQRAFSGFAALPPATPMGPARRPWREVLGLGPELLATATSTQLAAAKVRHRELIKKHHPDAGGSHELAAEINAALAEAERELQGAQ